MFLQEKFIGVINDIEGFKFVRIIDEKIYFYSKDMLKLSIYNKDLLKIREINFKEGDCPECVKRRFNDIFIDNENIIICSPFQKKIVIYDSNGIFIKSMNTNNLPYLVLKDRERIITFESIGNKSFIVFYDSNGKFLYNEEIPQSDFSKRYNVSEAPLAICFDDNKLFIPESYRFWIWQYDIERNLLRKFIKSGVFFKKPIIKKRGNSTGVIILSTINNIFIYDTLITIYTIGTKYGNTLLLYNKRGERLLFIKNLRYDDIIGYGRNIYAIKSDSIYSLSILKK